MASLESESLIIPNRALVDPDGRLASAMDSQSHEFRMIHDSDLRCTWVSASVEPVLGYRPDSFMNRSLRTTVDPDDCSTVMSGVRGLLEEPGGRCRLQFRLRHADGEWRRIEWVADNLLTEGGIVSTLRDVSAHSEARSRLKESERRLRSIISSAGDMVLLLERSGRINYVTPTATVLLGRSPTFVKREWMSLVHPDDNMGLTRLFNDSKLDPGNTAGPADVRLRSFDGTWLTFEIRITDFTRDPVIRAIVANVRDVSRHRQVEEESRRNRQLFTELVDMAPVGIFLADRVGDWTYANAAIRREFGLKSSGIAGLGLSRLFGTEDSRRLSADFASWDGEGYFSAELTKPTSGGLSRYRVTMTRPFGGGIVGNIENVTSRRELEENLINNAALGSLADVVGSAAHDIHNILSSIGFQVEMVSREAEPDRVSAIGDAIDRACDITTDLMSMSRPRRRLSSGIDVRPVVDGMASMLAALAEPKAQLSIAYETSDTTACFDEHGLTRVLTNLVINSRDAVGPSGRIRVTVSEVQVGQFDPLVLCNPGRYVAISVRDNGCGIPGAVIDRVFEPYFTTKSDGNGIGLAASRRNVRTWGGDIAVESTEGKGTTVTVLLRSGSNLG